MGCSGEPLKAPPKPSIVHGGDVRAFAVTEASAGRAVGDLALVGPQLEINVRDRGHPAQRGNVFAIKQPEGAPNKDALAFRAHDWEGLELMLEVDGQLRAPVIGRVSVARAGGRPAIVIEGALELGGSDAGVVNARGGAPVSRLELTRILRIADVGSALRITTRVRVTRGPSPRSLRIVERVFWGGGTPIAPLLGALQPGQRIEADWIGRSNDGRAVVAGAREGRIEVLGHNIDHARADLLRFTDVYLEPRGFPEAQPQRFEADFLLAASHAGLARAVRQLGWARGQPFPEVVAMLTTNPPNTQVRVVDAQTGQLVISGIPDDKRRAILPLSPQAVGRPLHIGARSGGVEASEWIALEGPPYRPVSLAVPVSSVLKVSVSHAVTGEPLPARIRILPRRSSAAPNLGPDWKASGALDTVIAPAGRAEVRLSPGYYRVIATHGPEWSAADELVELDVGTTRELEVALERAIDPGPWLACELHVHADPSVDSQVSLEDRVASLVAEGIAFAVPTDHNHVTDLGAAVAAQPLWGLFTVPGVEVTTDAPIFGHFNAYPYPIDPALPGQGAPEYRGLHPRALFEALHAAGPDVVVQVNHPRIEGGIGYFERAEYDAARDEGGELWSADFDALEVWNGFDLARWANVERVLGDWLAMLEHGHRVVATGSSDSHTIRSEGAGYPRTYVRAPLSGVAHGVDVVRALRRGRAFVTSGPFLTVQIGEHTVGDAVTLREGEPIELRVSVQVPHWMPVSTLRVHLGTEVLRELPMGPPTSASAAGRRYTRTLRLSIGKPGPLVVAVEGEGSLQPIIARQGVRPFAFTNPIWLVRPGERPPEPWRDRQQNASEHGHPHGSPLALDAGPDGGAQDAAAIHSH